MNILITGGEGRLARRLVPELQAFGHKVTAPSALELDAAEQRDILTWIPSRKPDRPDLVISLAAYTKVNDLDLVKHIAGNVQTAIVTGSVCANEKIPFIYVSSDYVLAQKWEETPYIASKRIGEDVTRALGGTVVRVAFCDPDDAKNWTWVNGYSLAHREWVEDTAKRLAEFVQKEGWLTAQGTYNLGPKTYTTRETMLRDRFPGHPALEHVVRSENDHTKRVGYAAPRDTRFPKLWSPEW